MNAPLGILDLFHRRPTTMVGFQSIYCHLMVSRAHVEPAQEPMVLQHVLFNCQTHRYSELEPQATEQGIRDAVR